MEPIYIINALTILGYAWFLNKYQIKGFNNKIVFLFICSVQISLIVGLRYEVGADWSSYQKMYLYYGESASGMYHYDRVEIGYRIISMLVYKIGFPFWSLNMLLIIMTMFFLSKSIFRLSCNVGISFYLYISFCYMYFAMNQVRQGLAMAIAMFAMSKLMENKRTQFVLFVLIGSLFHYVVLIFIPLLFVKNKPINRKCIWGYLIVGGSSFLLFPIIRLLLSHTVYSFYLNDAYESQSASIFFNLLVRLMLLVFVLCSLKELNKTYKCILMSHIAIWCTILQILTIQSSIFGRTTTPFFLIYIFLIPEMMNVVSKKYVKVFNCVIIFVASFYHIIYMYAAGKNILINSYKSIF